MADKTGISKLTAIKLLIESGVAPIKVYEVLNSMTMPVDDYYYSEDINKYIKKKQPTPEQGFKDMLVRFFIWHEEPEHDEEGEGDYIECFEPDFIIAEGVIEYERFTVFDHGCKQICLTKNPFI